MYTGADRLIPNHQKSPNEILQGEQMPASEKQMFVINSHKKINKTLTKFMRHGISIVVTLA